MPTTKTCNRYMMRLLSPLNPNCANGIRNVTIRIKCLTQAIQLKEKLFKPIYGKFLQVHNQSKTNVCKNCCRFGNISKYCYFKFKSLLFSEYAELRIKSNINSFNYHIYIIINKKKIDIFRSKKSINNFFYIIMHVWQTE